MMHSFCFGNEWDKAFNTEGYSSDFGVFISGDNVFNSPERDIETVSIEGRNGDLIIDKGRYKNIRLSYPCFMRGHILCDLGFRMDRFKSYMYSKKGYQKLKDSYDNFEHFRLARFTDGLNFDVHFLKAAEFELSFDCKPQRFLVSGENKIEITGNDIIYNPTSFEALPIIKVYGNGKATLRVNDDVIKFNNIDEYVTLDSDTQNAFKDTANKNNTILAERFPNFTSGRNSIIWEGNIEKLEIIPRWWEL